ncbi:hypothetical protein MATR_03290 [Marivirga tractuosa]|uniref:DUF4270 domain-containing protein n=1 Tax=Marivirga tractuosa (strain ATCC 23168 / DSM 4126 / NBRC 15989 / NCIMB 1408 / VKM B-1430 / H-43) TaxID=643867 RepID=E4TUB9_MARTH|nr:hypothetical protein Ftrac_2052 [Marivirga tractuosa DSM 4126]BDD13504.1 hypothetical protein MATR_03290 [Marivirga tractuosa]
MKNPISTYIQNWQANTATSIITGPALLLAFFFASCEEPIEVESDLVPGGNNAEIRYVEIPLEINHAAYDTLLVSTNVSILEGARGQVFVGHQNNPEIGNFSAQAYFGAILSNSVNRDSVKFGSEVIETRLHLGFNYYYGTEYGNPQKFRLYQLADTLKSSGIKSIENNKVNYYTVNDELSTSEEIAVNGTTIINPKDTIPDYISLGNNFGNDLLDLVRDEDLTPEEIYSTLKGFKLEVEPGQNNLQALSLAGQSSYFEVIYQSPTADTLQSVTFNLSSSSFTHVDFQPGSLIPSTFSGNNSFDLTDPSKAYFNNLLGISPKINLDPYLSFIDSVDYMQINKAEIIIESQNFTTLDTPFEQVRPAQAIIPYILEETGGFKKQGRDFWAIQSNFTSNGGIANQSAGTSPTNLSYDDSKNQIRGDISFFLQEIYNDPSFWTEGNNFVFTGQFIRVNNDAFTENPIINIGNFDNFLVDKENIKLRIYYTTFK